MTANAAALQATHVAHKGVKAVTRRLPDESMRDIATGRAVHPPPAGPRRPGDTTLDIARRVD